MTRERQRLGQLGEDAAAQWYENHGFKILGRNWRVREGELDIVAARGPTVVFVEVKARSTSRFGTGAEAVTPAKQLRIRRLAILWLGQSPTRYRNLRFDVVDVSADGHLIVYPEAF